MRRVVLGAAVVAVAAAPATAAAAAGDPQLKHTAGGAARAASVLLRPSDFGSGWTRGRPASAGGGLSCKPVLTPDRSALVETGRASTPLFTRGAGQAVAQEVRIYASSAQADEAWARTLTRKLVICMEQQLEDASGMSSPVSVTKWYRLAPPKYVRHVAGVRVIATAKTGKKTSSNVYLDVLLLGRGPAMTTIVLSAVRKPFTRSFEHRLVRAASHRLLTG